MALAKQRGVLLLCLLGTLVCGCKEEILHDLSEMRANQVLLILERAQISAEKIRSGKDWVVRVPDGQAMEALSLIDESRLMVRDLERNKDQSRGLMQSREDRAQANERELAWDLENTLERMPGVREAKVHLSIESDSPLAKVKTRPPSSASVLLVVAKEDAAVVEKAKQLIAGAAGLPATQVSVVLTKIEEVAKRSLVPASRTGADWLPLMGGVAGVVSVLLIGTAFLRRVRRRPKTLGMLADTPLRPQMSFPDAVQIQRDEMELQ